MPPRAREKRTLATCCATHTLDDGLSDVSYVLLPLLAQSFGLSLAQVGLIRSAHRAAMVVSQIPAGLVAERFGERSLLALGTLVAGAAFLLLPLLGVVLQGKSSVLYATIGELVEEARLPRAFGLFYTIGSVCGIAAPLGFGLIGDRFGLETAIATMGAAILLTVPLAMRLKPSGALRLRGS